VLCLLAIASGSAPPCRAAGGDAERRWAGDLGIATATIPSFARSADAIGVAAGLGALILACLPPAAPTWPRPAADRDLADLLRGGSNATLAAASGAPSPPSRGRRRHHLLAVVGLLILKEIPLRLTPAAPAENSRIAPIGDAVL